MADTGLVINDLRIRLADTEIVRLDATVGPGEVLSVMGPSGVGKSTLLAAISGTLAPEFVATGRVVLNGEDITGLPVEARRIGMLFQDELLFPHLDVGGNVAFGLRARVKGARARRAAVDAALSEVGLGGFAGRDTATLSGGQKARVALMRMLLSEPRALLLDEAFSRLDSGRRDQIRKLVFGAAKSRRLPVIQVTHDRADAEAAEGQILTLD